MCASTGDGATSSDALRHASPAGVLGPSGLAIRSMTSADLEFAARCVAGERWSPETPNEFAAFLEHDRSGCLLAEIDRTRAGICIASFYGSGQPNGAMGFIGMLIVRPEYRGRGIGKRLLTEAIGYLRERGAGSIQLDGVTLAVPLYERMGFRRHSRSLRFHGTLEGRAHPSVRPMTEADLPAVCAMDIEAFGADRSFFLRRRVRLFSHLCRVYEENGEITGFMVGRSGVDANGSWTAAGPLLPSPEAGSTEALLRSLAAPGEKLALNVNVLDTCRPAAPLLDGLGFDRRDDPPWRMVIGDEGVGLSPRYFAIGPAAKG